MKELIQYITEQDNKVMSYQKDCDPLEQSIAEIRKLRGMNSPLQRSEKLLEYELTKEQETYVITSCRNSISKNMYGMSIGHKAQIKKLFNEGLELPQHPTAIWYCENILKPLWNSNSLMLRVPQSMLYEDSQHYGTICGSVWKAGWYASTWQQSLRCWLTTLLGYSLREDLKNRKLSQDGVSAPRYLSLTNLQALKHGYRHKYA